MCTLEYVYIRHAHRCDLLFGRCSPLTYYPRESWPRAEGVLPAPLKRNYALDDTPFRLPGETQGEMDHRMHRRRLTLPDETHEEHKARLRNYAAHSSGFVSRICARCASHSDPLEERPPCCPSAAANKQEGSQKTCLCCYGLVWKCPQCEMQSTLRPQYEKVTT